MPHNNIKQLSLSTLLLSFFCANSFADPVPNPKEVIVKPLKNAKGVIIGKSKTALNTKQRSKRSTLLSNVITLNDWYNLGYDQDGIEGADINNVYNRFSLNNSSQPIIVAVIDSGVDIHHEDLQGKIWVNSDEIPNNGIDDDNNGYVDDINGWNFIGGPDGSHLVIDSKAVTREYAKYKKLMKSGVVLSEEQQKYYANVEKNYNQALSDSGYNYWLETEDNINYSKSVLATNGISDYSRDSIENLTPSDSELIDIKEYLLAILDTYGSYSFVDKSVSTLRSYYDLNYDPRPLIVKDDPNNLREVGYGNNDVVGPTAGHGTHVAGIIAANRDNGIGINGVASNVRIMAIRAVSDGDERDKDVANAIRYAVDNGARIINMSFAKHYSPHKEVVIDALQYAEYNDVLLVRGAGNDSQNLDISPSYYPNRNITSGVTLSNWLNVGASSSKPEKLAAYFTNYGKEHVDLFAPGEAILSTVPGNQYKQYSGSSLAAPVVSGIAALALSQFPELDAHTLTQYLLKTVRTYPDLQVKKPDASQDNEVISFADLSISSGIINAYSLMEALARDAGITFSSNNHCAIKINSIYNGYIDDPRALENCIAQTHISSQQSNKYYYVFVPAETKLLKLSIAGREGNADLYVSEAKNGWPTISQNDFASTVFGSTEVIEIKNPVSNQFYHIMIKPTSGYNNVSLKAELINYTLRE